VAALETAARTAVVGPPTYLTDGSEDSWQDELGACSPRSQLSNWSDSEAEELGSTAGTAGATAVGTAGGIAGGAAAGTAGGTAAADHETGAPAGTAPDTAGDAAAPRQTALSAALHLAGNCKLSPPPPPPRRESPYHRASLSVWLASKQSGGHPERVLEPRLCFHERELVQQVKGGLSACCICECLGLHSTPVLCIGKFCSMLKAGTSPCNAVATLCLKPPRLPCILPFADLVHPACCPTFTALLARSFTC
jgi:hypothetical protein